METTRIDSLFQRAQALFSGAKACYNRGRVKQTGEEHPMQIMDQFGAAPGAESVRMPDGTERTLAAEHAAAILVNEQPAFRVVCTPELLPQLALGRLLTESWINSADEVERVAVCAQGLKISVQLRHPLAAAEQAGQEVPSCCTDNLTLASPVRLPPLAPVPQREIPAAWVDALADAMGQGLPLYRATHAVHSCLLLRAGKILYRCEDLGRHNALDKAVGSAAGGVCALYQRPGAGGYGAQGHPGRCARAGEQEYAHGTVAGAGRGIWIETVYPAKEMISPRGKSF